MSLHSTLRSDACDYRIRGTIWQLGAFSYRAYVYMAPAVARRDLKLAVASVGGETLTDLLDAIMAKVTSKIGAALQTLELRPPGRLGGQRFGHCREIHVVADDLSTHKAAEVETFLQGRANVHLHFTAIHPSWLDQVEFWFGKIGRDVIARGLSRLITDLKKQLTHCIQESNTAPRTVEREYTCPSWRISRRLLGKN